jgi:hypothetical protein
LHLKEFPRKAELSTYNAEISEMKNKLGVLHEKYEDKIILFVPIQALDYWILYQKYKVEGRRYNNNGLESKNKDDVKELAYGNKGANGYQITKIINQITDIADFEELASQSKSFNLFHSQIKAFIENF